MDLPQTECELLADILRAEAAKQDPDMTDKIHRTRIVYEVLSEGPLPSDVSLMEILYECEEGGWMGSWTSTTSEELSDQEAVKAVYEFGGDPEFFELDGEAGA